MPPPVRSRSPTSPTGIAVAERVEQLAARLAQPDEPDPGHAARPLEPRLEARVVDRLHRRDGLADPERQEQRPRARPSRSGARRRGRPCPATTASAMSSGVSSDEPLVDVRPASTRRRPGDLEVVARRVAERGADEPFERLRVGRGGTDRGTARAGRGERPADPAQVAARLGGAVRVRAGTRGRRRGRRGGTAGPRAGGRRATTPPSRSRPRTLTRRLGGRGPAADSSRSVAVGAGRPGSGRPACISRRAALEVGGLLGGRRPDRLEAVPLLRRGRDRSRPAASAMRLGRALEVGRVGRGDRRSARRTRRGTCRRPGGDGDGRIRAPVLAASVAGPAGSVVQASNRRTGIPSLR